MHVYVCVKNFESFYVHVIHEQRYPFQFGCLLAPFLALIALARASSTMLNKSSKSQLFFPILRKMLSVFLNILSMM